MELLNFDAKKGQSSRKHVSVALKREELFGLLGGCGQISAFLNGGLVHIYDNQVAQVLFEVAGFGQFMDDEREERSSVSRKCFTDQNEEFQETASEKWQNLSPAITPLILSPEETVFLTLEWRILVLKIEKTIVSDEEIWKNMQELSGKSVGDFGKTYAVFRHLKQNGWIVRSGSTFGCEYLIYCLGTQYYHASAGVLVADEVAPLRLLTLTRILAHNKKALMVATCPRVERFDDVASAEVGVATMKTYFLERDVPSISNRNNEVYDV